MFDEIGVFEPILEAKDADHAYSVFDSAVPDIVVLDIHIPGDNEIKVLAKLKKERPGVIKIMLTNYPYEHYGKKCIELDADYFFEKTDDMNKIYEI
jgi:DNA-binding NarL/FixJ family response regulator